MLVSITLDKALAELPKREVDDYKGKFGHLLILGGTPGMSGAVRLAGEAALRIGAGKVTVATAPDHAALINIGRPELMTYPMRTAADVDLLGASSSHWVIGPGLGKGQNLESILLAALNLKKPVVMDADALTWLATKKEIRHPNWILTPHPGEAARLLGCSIEEVQADRVVAVSRLQATWGGVVVLKGAGTLIAGPDRPVHICPAANPAMATAGMGDILSGFIGGLIAQEMKPFEAALLATIIHAQAADRACQGSRGLVASDLFSHVGALLNSRGS